jgi:H+-transporting ATPase
MLLSSGADILIVSALATRGVLMAPLPLLLVVGLLGAVMFYLFVVDYLKVQIFKYFGVV